MARMMTKTRVKSKSSRAWLKRHHSDRYVQQAKESGYRSRAAYKLLEIQEKDKILVKGMTVVDLGAAPGGWSQIVAKRVGQSGKVIALDILPMESINGVDIVLGDFHNPEVLGELMKVLEGKPVDLVISDMAPNLSGISVIDQARAFALAESALDFASKVLAKNGAFLIKLFQGSGFQGYVNDLKGSFQQVLIRKPKASRLESKEIYLLAKGYKPKNEGRVS